MLFLFVFFLIIYISIHILLAIGIKNIYRQDSAHQPF